MIIKETNYEDKDFIELCERLEQEHIDNIKEQRSPNANCLKNLEKFTKVFIAYDGKAIGCIAIKEDTTIEVGRLYVLPDYRNQGIGKNIIKNILKQNDTVYLWVYKKNKKAIKLYKKLGFNIIEETESRYYMKYKKENS